MGLGGQSMQAVQEPYGGTLTVKTCARSMTNFVRTPTIARVL